MCNLLCESVANTFVFQKRGRMQPSGREQKDGVQGRVGNGRLGERICLCRLHTHYNLGNHIRSLSLYTKLLLIIDTALQLFCFIYPSPKHRPSRRLTSLLSPSSLLPFCPTPSHCSAVRLLARSHGRCAYIIVALATQPAAPKQSSSDRRIHLRKSTVELSIVFRFLFCSS